MSDIRIGKSCNDIIRIVDKLLTGQIKGWYDLIVNTFFDMSEHTLIINAALYCVKSREKSVWHQRSMSTVENSYLSCSVHIEIIGKDNIESALVKGDFLGETVITLDYPQMEIFACVDHLIVKANLDLLFLGITRVDAVDEGVAEDIVILYPSLEVVAKLPEVGIFQNALFQICAVLVDKLARKEYETVKSRLATYHSETEPLKDFYAQRGKLKSVENQPTIEAVTASIIEALGM